MPADLSLREGNLPETLAQLSEQVRKEPANAKHRIFLFQLLSVMGEWERANTQLSVIGEMDAGALAMVQMYREAIKCELLRAEIFAGRRSPVIFGQPASWLALLIEALRLTAENRYAEAARLREMAFEQAPTTRGAVDENGFEWIADADTRLGPVLEAIVNGRYWWIPFNRITKITIDEPSDLRDVVWMPAHFTMASGGEVVALIPTRYPGSEVSGDGGVRLARKTEWVEPAEGAYHGLGQRMLATDSGEYSLMDVRSIRLEGSDEESAGAESPEAGGATPGTKPPEV
jgi:type VI secretion system protein ImpE